MKTTRTLILASTLLAASAASGDSTPDGAALYKSRCAMCHGADGKGQTAMGKNMKVRDLTSLEVQKQSDDQLSAMIADGKGKMPAYKGKMTAGEIQAVVVHIRDLAKKK